MIRFLLGFVLLRSENQNRFPINSGVTSPITFSYPEFAAVTASCAASESPSAC